MKFKYAKKFIALALACSCIISGITVPCQTANAQEAANGEQAADTDAPQGECGGAIDAPQGECGGAVDAPQGECGGVVTYISVISHTSLAMYPNMAKQLKINIPLSDITWSSSNNKIVSIMGSRGKNHQIVTFRSHNKTGICKIKAKVNGSTYTCKVTVKKDNKIARAKLVKVTKTSKSITVKVKLQNQSKKDLYYGYPYEVEKFVDGAWKKIPSDKGFPMVAWKVPAHSSKTKDYCIANGSEMAQYSKGTYRMAVEFVPIKKENRYVLFTIK